MGTRALAILLLTPSLALGQTAGLVVADPAEVGRANCATETVGLTWAGTATPVTGDNWRVAVYADTESCPTTAVASTASNVLVANQVAVAGTAIASVTLGAGALPTKGGVTCVSSGSAADVAKKICVWLVTNPGGTETSVLAAQGPFTFQFARPPAPVLDGVRPANGALLVDFHRGADLGLDDAVPSPYRVYVYGPTGDPACDVDPVPVDPVCLVKYQDVSVSGSRVGGLVNGTKYTVLLTGFSSGGNESVASASATGTPLPFVSFWEQYQDAGGQEQGGCGGGAGALSLLALLPLALRRRRP